MPGDGKAIRGGLLFAALMENTSDAMVVVTPGGIVEAWNRAASDLFGLPGEAAVGEDIASLHQRLGVGEGAGPRVMEEFRSLFGRSRGHPYRRDIEFTRADGAVLSLRIEAYSSGEGEDARALVTARDVTGDSEARRALRLLTRATEQSPVCVVITKVDGSIVYVNRKFMELTGYSLGETIGKNPRILQSGKTDRAVYREMWQSILSGREWSGVFQNRKKSGELYWESANVSPLVEDDGTIRHFIAVKEDITERKRVADDLARRMREIRCLDAVKAELQARLSPEDFMQRVFSHLAESTGEPERAYAWAEVEGVRHSMRGKVPCPGESACAEILMEGNARGRLCLGVQGRVPDGSDGSLVDMVAKSVGFYFERKADDERVREARNRFELLFEKSPESITLTRLSDGVLVECNEGFSRVTGYAREEVAGKPVAELGLYADLRDRARTMSSLKEDGNAFVEARFRRKDGTEFVGAGPTSLVMLGDAPHVLAMMRDVTEERRMAEAVRRSEAKLRTVVQNIDVYVYILDVEDGRVVSGYHSPQCQAITGYPPPAFEADPDLWVSICHPDDVDSVLALYRANREGRTLPPMEHRIVRKDGEIRWVFNSASVELDPSGGTRMIEGFVMDITARVEMEHRLREAMSAAEEANRAKTEFLATMSHELRTPLNAIVGFSQLLAMGETGPLNDRQRRFVDNIKTGGDHLLGMISSTLDMAKIESGKLELSTSEFGIRELVESVVAAATGLAERKGISLTASVAGGIGTLVADETRTRQILLNLVSNAIKFTGKGGSVSLSASAEGDRALFAVRDDGIGIPPEDRDRIFGAYEQVRARDAANQGTGLGLFITQRLVDMHGGRLELTSQPGKGSEFRVVMPGRKPPGTGTSVHEKSAESPESAVRDAAGVRVLFVEDSEINRELLSAMLEGMGAIWAAAGTGGEGVELARSGNYDLILMDVDLPDMSGLEATALIRAFSGPELPIVAVTAHAMRGDRERFVAAGMNDVLFKPFDGAALRAVVIAASRAGRATVPGRDPSKPESTSGFDASAAASRIGIPEERYRALLATFLGSLSGPYLEDLRSAAASGDAERARRSAHKFKGACASLRLEGSAEILASMEEAAARGNLPGAGEIRRLELELGRIASSFGSQSPTSTA